MFSLTVHFDPLLLLPILTGVTSHLKQMEHVKNDKVFVPQEN